MLYAILQIAISQWQIMAQKLIQQNKNTSDVNKTPGHKTKTKTLTLKTKILWNCLKTVLRQDSVLRLNITAEYTT